MSFVQSGDETGSASCASAAEAPIAPFEQAHRREAGRTGVLVCTSIRRNERREMVELRAWGNFMIRRQRAIEEVFMPGQAASRAPRLADVDRPGAVRRLNTCGMKISHQKYIMPHQEMAKQTGTVSPQLCMNQEFSQTTRAREDARSAMEECLVFRYSTKGISRFVRRIYS